MLLSFVNIILFVIEKRNKKKRNEYKFSRTAIRFARRLTVTKYFCFTLILIVWKESNYKQINNREIVDFCTIFVQFSLRRARLNKKKIFFFLKHLKNLFIYFYFSISTTKYTKQSFLKKKKIISSIDLSLF